MPEEIKFVTESLRHNMKIFRCDQIRMIDEYTIRNEPVASIDLMERAARRLFDWYTERFDRSRRVRIFAGPGNNGGDGLALARMLAHDRYDPEVFFLNINRTASADWQVNRKRLGKECNVHFTDIRNVDDFPMINGSDVIIDAIFGSGLSRPADGLASEVIRMINNSPAVRVSVDIPSGMSGESNTHVNNNNTVKADYTLSFQFPKLAFMFPENASYAGDWYVLPVGLDHSTFDTPYSLLEKETVAPLLKPRNKFDHKGTFGHALLTGGSYGRMGAVVLGAKAALRTGAGLVTCHVPKCGTTVLQTAVPEAMVNADSSEHEISRITSDARFDAAGIGPGMGTDTRSQAALHEFLSAWKKPLVVDADGLNILSLNKKWLKMLPSGAVLTPHPGEFERLAGKSSDSYERLGRQVRFSQDHNCIVVLKGAHTSVTAPGGEVWFNSTGNPGMATAGSGDVLTGIILSLLSQGYEAEDAAVIAVYLHGSAGDIAAAGTGNEALIASDIIGAIGSAFKRIKTA